LRNLLSVGDLDTSELEGLINSAASIKEEMKAGRNLGLIKGRVVGLLFEKPSTRTRTSFESAAFRLGGSPIYLPSNELQLSRGEPIEDTARILGGYLDVIVARVYSDATVRKLARWSGVPVINALSDAEHPTQIISDFLAMKEAKGRLRGTKLAYIGDGDNVCNSLMLGAALEGIDFAVACPRGYEPDQRLLSRARKLGRGTGSKLEVVRRPETAARDADFLYTDVWVSMGEDAEKEKRMKDFQGYQINSELIRAAKKGVKVLHCLPAHRGQEITEDAIEGPNSIVWEQGEDKLYGAAATLSWALSAN